MATGAGAEKLSSRVVESVYRVSSRQSANDDTRELRAPASNSRKQLLVLVPDRLLPLESPDQSLYHVLASTVPSFASVHVGAYYDRLKELLGLEPNTV